MKRSLSICILVIFLLAILIGYGLLRNNYKSNVTDDESQILVDKEENTTEKTVETNIVVEANEYFLTNDNGNLVITDKNGEIFCNTNISFEAMGAEDKKMIEEGNYGFKNIAEVYDFLESYSS